MAIKPRGARSGTRSETTGSKDKKITTSSARKSSVAQKSTKKANSRNS